MRLKTAGWMMVAAAVLAAAACRDEGGELRDATERRRAEMANRDTSADNAPDDAAPKQGGAAGGVVTLRGVRAASNPEGFDRMVLEFGDAPVPAWRVAYATRPVLSCGSGEPVQVEGARWLRVRLQSAQAHDDQGRPTVRQRRLPLGMPALREMVIACDFEGEVEVVLGVSAANPYRVLQLANPTRLVIDVQRQP